MKNELLAEAKRRLEPRYSRTYKVVVTVALVAVYSYGYYLTWVNFGGEL